MREQLRVVKMKFAVVQVRGTLGMNKKFKDTLKFLKLVRKNSCVVLDDNRNYLGMLVLLKDYITWGNIDEQTFKLLLEKRGRLFGNKLLTEDYLKEKMKFSFDEFTKNFFTGRVKLKDVAGLKPFFRLMPPRGGFDRGGIKKPFSLGGSLGYRGDHINNLIRRML